MVLAGIVAFLAAPVAITPADPRVHLVGRFDRRDPKAVRSSWPGTGVELRVQGAELEFTAEDTGQNYYQIEQNGKPTQVIKLSTGPNTVKIPIADPKKPTLLRILKRTEAFIGAVTFTGFKLASGKFLRAEPPKRRLEVIGDSITCGYGNEGKNQNEKFNAETENAYMSYASIAARHVGAEVTLNAWSGRKMYPDNTLPSIYDLTNPLDATSVFDFKAPAPDAVVINLATNDFGAGNPEETAWVGAYEAFIAQLRKHYPKAAIYPAIGSMMSDAYPPNVKALSTLRGYLTRMVARLNAKGDANVRLIEFEGQKFEDGIGSDFHPNIVTHQKMAEVLVKALRRDLKW